MPRHMTRAWIRITGVLLIADIKFCAVAFAKQNFVPRTTPTNFVRQTTHCRMSNDNKTREHLLIDEEIDEYCEVVDSFGCQAYESFHDASEKVRWIRLEKQLDDSLTTIHTQQDVWKKVDWAQHEQSKYGNSTLYSRTWQQLTPATNSDNTVATTVDATTDTTNTLFRVAQFNSLAEGLSSGPLVKRPFAVDPLDTHAQTESVSYGGFGLPGASASVSLDFSLRKWRILQVLLTASRSNQNSTSYWHRDNSMFDLMAIQEMDRHRGFFAPILRLFGYDGYFAYKTRSPCVRLGWYSDGSSLFWRKTVFELISCKRQEYRVGTQVYILAVLLHKHTRRRVIVAVTHLKAQSNVANEKIRCSQVDELLEEVSKLYDQIGSCNEEKCPSALILGDLNSESDDSCVGRILQHTKLASHFESAYDLNAASFYTTYKVRGTKTTKRAIDYIFHSGSLKCTSTLDVPAEEELEETKLPGLRNPSDHLMIAAEFMLIE
jgi:mRNA deadenylase 3'-5' endonuclease subunit Ccr4